ncbi:uncharacterized protein N7518_003923 [Penicillium psychrosexuale]|uniref:uncharacterized protein n=1 Tax=Penicillium psychrosexuale TaxID=1002107 RepID=UPI0025450700|nr:uncharacterized protein N7518_003923 [Penicillium psychrosexuale]KAJ5795383.1 hypothetical protein N7518_003923 [Penicillium psychrosexuale]
MCQGIDSPEESASLGSIRNSSNVIAIRADRIALQLDHSPMADIHQPDLALTGWCHIALVTDRPHTCVPKVIQSSGPSWVRIVSNLWKHPSDPG